MAKAWKMAKESSGPKPDNQEVEQSKSPSSAPDAVSQDEVQDQRIQN